MSDKIPVSCPHRPDCDGCPLLEQSPENKRKHKRERLTTHLQYYPHLKDATVLPLYEAEQTLGYRNRARMVVLPQANHPEALFGFYKKNSRDPVVIQKCLAHLDALESVLLDLRVVLFASSLKMHTRFIDARHLDGDTIVTLCVNKPADDVVKTQWIEQAKQLAQALRQTHPQVGVLLSLSTKQQAIGSGQAIHIAPPFALQHMLPPHKDTIEVPSAAFFQLHTAQLHHAHQLMRQWMTPVTTDAPKILDLYCGIGVHGLGLCPQGGQIFGADINEDAITAAQKNAAKLGIESHYITSNDDALEPWLAQHVSAQLDVTIVNPGRAGLSVALVNALNNVESTDLFYLSCEPKTLRRDLARLCHRGWRVVQMQPMDFMPQTDQVETLTLLRRGASERTQDAHWPTDHRTWPTGISGIDIPSNQGDDRHLHWLAFVSGTAPTHGQPTHLQGQTNPPIHVKVLNTQGPNSWVHITTPVWEDTHALAIHLCQRMRAWKHPILGDATFGVRASNQWFKRKHFGDRVALHCALVAKHASKKLLLRHAPGLFFEWGLETISSDNA